MAGDDESGERRGDGGVALGWLDEGQRRWPLDAPGPDGERPDTVAFRKELELR